MTEEEAHTKWCPFTKSRQKPSVWCIASDCMAWRLFSPLNPNDGYCGLAGQPNRFNNHPNPDDC